MNKSKQLLSASKRAKWIFPLIAFFLCLCIVRLFVVQIIQGPGLAEEGLRVRTSASDLPPRRGSITDANGLMLAESVQGYHIAVNQNEVSEYKHRERHKNNKGKYEDIVVGKGALEAAKQLSPLLGINPVELGGKMTGTSTYRYIKKNVDPITYRKIRALRIPGVASEPVFERMYPNNSTAAPLIGDLNADGNGVSGLEATSEERLRGKPGREAYEIDPTGAIIPGGKQVVSEPVPGDTVQTNIYADLQYSVQQLLDSRVKRHQADWGSVVMIDIPTGQINVMADSGSHKPDPRSPQPVGSVQYAFEPGSVGKILTFATALEKGKITPTTAFKVPDRLNDLPGADGPITDFHNHGVIPWTATGILAESSNVGTVLVGKTVSDQDRYDTMKKFGLGERTGVELPGESAGVLHPTSGWKGRDRWVNMFGQSYSMSALQEAEVMATIGNEGVRIPPRLVHSWKKSSGAVEPSPAVEQTRAISSDTARNLITMMESVSSKEGTGGAAAVPGYRSAVKTGTAEIHVDGAQGVVSSLAGIIPADKPRLAISVVLYNPKVGYISAESAAPLFSEVATVAVRALAIPASPSPAHLFPMTTG